MKFILATLIFANIGCLYKNIKRDKKLKQKEQELIFLDKYQESIKINNEEISIIKHIYIINYKQHIQHLNKTILMQ